MCSLWVRYKKPQPFLYALKRRTAAAFYNAVNGHTLAERENYSVPIDGVSKTSFPFLLEKRRFFRTHSPTLT